MLKVAVVGLRGIGNRHARCYHENEKTDLVAVCDLVEPLADEAAEKYGCPQYSSLQAVLDAHPKVDVIDVSTGGDENGSWHFEPTMEALEAGKHVLVEKPISNDIGEAREMVQLATERNLYLGCNLNHYFSQPADKAREWIGSGRIGEQIYCLHRMGFAGGEYSYDGPAGGNLGGYPYAHVKAFLAHPFSIMRHFCGDILEIQAFMGQPGFRRNANDPMISVNSIHVRFTSGAIGYLFSQRGDATMGLGGWWSFELGGSKGTVSIENCVEKATLYPTPGSGGGDSPEKLELGQSPEPEVFESGESDFGLTFAYRINAFIDDVTDGVPKHELRASGRDALATLEYTFAAIKSYELGGEVVRPFPLPTIKRRPVAESS
jgi:predicted dehydrogenase